MPPFANRATDFGATVLIHVISLALVLCMAGCNADEDDTDSPHDAAIAEFTSQVDDYMRLHNELEKNSASAGGATTSTMQADRDTLRAAITSRRKYAHQGDIFTPAAAAAFRQLLNPEVRGGDAAATRSAIREDGPNEFPLKPNAPYPDDAPLTTMPPNVLAVLPSLPEHLEYRLVDNHLILRDVHANIVVDYMFDVMCARC